MCEGGKHQFIHSPYNDGSEDHPRWVMNGMPHSSVWPTIELRTVVRAVGNTGKLAFYQDKDARPGKKYKPEPSSTPANKHELTPGEWPSIENGMALGDAPHPLDGPEVISNKSKDDVYEEFIYRIARTRSTAEPTKATFDAENMRSPLKEKGRSFFLDRLANEHFWTSTPDGTRPNGSADGRKKPKGHEYTHVIKPDDTNPAKTHNVSQGLLRVVQRAMAAGVMIELYCQMQEVSLFCFVNNALPRIKAHLYENMDRFHTVEEAVSLAERFEIGRSGGVISKFSISAFQEHMGYTTNDYNSNNNNNNTEVSSHLAEQTQEELDQQYGGQSYDGQINAISRGFRRGGRRNTGPWSRGRGFSGSGGGFRPFIGNIERGKGLGNYHNANETAAAKKKLLCYRCGSSSHIVKDCQYAPVSTDGPKNFTGP